MAAPFRIAGHCRSDVRTTHNGSNQRVGQIPTALNASVTRRACLILAATIRIQRRYPRSSYPSTERDQTDSPGLRDRVAVTPVPVSS
jgi:hypothetical protein